MSLPLEKVQSISQDLKSFTMKPRVSRRMLERILGKLQFATIVDPVGRESLIAKLSRSFLKSRKMSRRALERVLGSLQFVSVTDPVLKAKLKDVNRVWLSWANKRLRDRKVLLPSILRRRLAPWSTARSLSRSVPLHFPPPSVIIHTDASLSG